MWITNFLNKREENKKKKKLNQTALLSLKNVVRKMRNL